MKVRRPINPDFILIEFLCNDQSGYFSSFLAQSRVIGAGAGGTVGQIVFVLQRWAVQDVAQAVK
jgi:hypothetical protein